MNEEESPFPSLQAKSEQNKQLILGKKKKQAATQQQKPVEARPPVEAPMPIRRVVVETDVGNMVAARMGTLPGAPNSLVPGAMDEQIHNNNAAKRRQNKAKLQQQQQQQQQLDQQQRAAVDGENKSHSDEEDFTWVTDPEGYEAMIRRLYCNEEDDGVEFQQAAAVEDSDAGAAALDDAFLQVWEARLS